MEPSCLHYSHLGNPFNNQMFEKGLNLMAKCNGVEIKQSRKD